MFVSDRQVARLKHGICMCVDNIRHGFRRKPNGTLAPVPLCGKVTKLKRNWIPPKPDGDTKRDTCRKCMELMPKGHIGEFEAKLIAASNEKVAPFHASGEPFNPYEIVSKVYDDLVQNCTRQDLDRYGLVGPGDEFAAGEKEDLINPIIREYQSRMLETNADAGHVINGVFVRHEEMLSFLAPDVVRSFMDVFESHLNDSDDTPMHERSDESLLETVRLTLESFALKHRPTLLLLLAPGEPGANGHDLTSEGIAFGLKFVAAVRDVVRRIKAGTWVREIRIDYEKGIVALPGHDGHQPIVFTDLFMRLPPEHEETAQFEALDPTVYATFFDKCVAASKELVLPPLTGANNVEVMAMNLGHFFARTYVDGKEFGTFPAYGDHPSLFKAATHFHQLAERLGVGRDTEELSWFIRSWVGSGYARLEIGHKLAANMSLTDVPDGIVKPPWDAWTLVVPDGVIGNIARIWIFCLEPVIIIDREGRRHEPSPLEKKLVQALIATSALALSNPDEFKKERRHAPTANASSNKRHGEKPDLSQVTYLLSSPVEIDFRPHIRDALEAERAGRKASLLTSQHMRRGHWTHQPYGPESKLRKEIWRKPTWVGPKDSKILLRPHQIKDSS
jgi:hypothetical protein